MDSLKRIQDNFSESLVYIERAVDVVAGQVASGADLMVESLRAGGKVLACGNGGSAADAQHFSSELLNRFEMERPPLAAIALTPDAPTITAIANDYAYSQIFAKQVLALGQRGDVLLVITSSGNSDNLISAVAAARENGLKCVAMSGKTGGSLSSKLSGDDVEILVPGDSTARIQEVHSIIIHCLCDLIDARLFGESA